MHEIEIVTNQQQTALELYHDAAQRFADIKNMFPEVTDISIEHNDVAPSALLELSKEYGNPLTFDKGKKCVSYNGLHLVKGGWFALRCNSKPVENPPADLFTVEVDGETFTFKS